MDNNFTIRLATKIDLEGLTNLHFASFSPEEHVPVILGRRYVKANYRWQLSNEKVYILVATVGDEIVGLLSVCNDSFELPMFIVCIPELIISLSLKPGLLLNRNLWARLFRIFKKTEYERNFFKNKGFAQLIVGVVASGYRGRGIFSKLIDAAKQKSLEFGKKALFAGVYKKNLITQSIFIKEGWEICPELETKATLFFTIYIG